MYYGLRSTQILGLFLSVMLLASCSPAPGPAPVKPQKTTKQEKPEAARYDSADYVLSIAQGRLLPASQKPDVSVINAFAAHAVKDTMYLQTVVVFEYKVKDNPTLYRIAAPVDPAASPDAWSGLQEVVMLLSAKPHTLHHVRTYTLVVENVKPIPVKNATAASLHQALDNHQTRLIGTASQIPVLEDAELHLDMVRFFTRVRARDAAYLTLEDTKQLLVLATNKKAADEDTLKRMVNDQISLESALRQAMPY